MLWWIVTVLVTFVSVTRGDHPVWISEIEEIDFPIQPTSRNSDTNYRLPKSVIPLDYDIHIDLFFAESTDRPFSYDGKETITIQAVENNVTSIVLHSNINKINGVLVSKNGVFVKTNGFSFEPQYHFLIINLLQPLEVNQNYTLFIDYTSAMNEGPMKRGIWRGWYKDDNGIERVYAATHFQPYNARQAFPCFDEPLFKATFKIHLSMPISYVGTFSNTDVESRQILNNNRIRYNFYVSPKMSTYLVTFLVSETFTVIASDESYTPAIRIIGRSNTVGLGDHALELTVKLTEHFNEYFKIPYSTLHPYLLNDHISSPDWASAATENWGMVSYRELYLVIDPRETIMSVEHYAATLVSHELAHKWLGNLITCYWWSNTWINEGFASYFGYFGAHEMFPQYDLHEHFNSRYLQTSLSFDSGVSTVPLNHDVNTPAQVTGHFGTISYSKGAAILRMLSDMITPATFQKACQYFLKDNPYKAVDQYDLYNAFARAVQEDQSLKEYLHFNFTDYYHIWVNEPGYPILLVNIDHASGEMRLKQERFYLSSSVKPTDEIYPLPITFTTKTSKDFSNLKPTSMMNSGEVVLWKDKREEWVIFNIQQHGHYRVHYDDKTWNLISEALLENLDSIHHLNRAQIVDDIFALMRSERMSYNFGFKILRFLRYEDNYHVWTTAISGYSWLRNRLREFPESQVIFDSFILSYMDHVIKKLGTEPTFNETSTVTLTRQEVLHFACNIGLDQCVQDSRSKFLTMRTSGTWVDPRIRRHVYIAGIREGGQADFDFLLERFQTSNFANDQLEILRGLAATRNPQLLRRYLDLTLEKEVRSHDKASSFSFALVGNKENGAVVLQFVKAKIDEIRKAYVEDSPATPVHTALVNLASYLNETELDDYEDWLRGYQSNSAQFTNAIAAINSARSVIAWGETNGDMILAAARGGASTIILSTLLVATMSLLTLFA